MAISKRKPNMQRMGKLGAPRDIHECSVYFRKDADNVIFQVTSDELPALHRIGLDDLFMSQGHIREPHWHPNAAELDYVVAGQVSISVLDPIRHHLLSYHTKPGKVVFIPMNWWHWITATSDDVHIVQVFSSAKRQIIEGSDMLRNTPPKVFQQAYDVNAKQFAGLLSPITNADELDYVVTGEVTVSILHPDSLQVCNYRLKPGQVSYIPKGWFHWITPNTEETHLLVLFNDGKIESVEGSDVLRLTPADVFQKAYDVHARQFAKEVAPITETLTIGPPSRHRR